MEVPLIGIVITLIFSAFFSGLEIAFISSNRLKIELDKAKGTFNSKILSVFYNNESRFIAMLLLGNNIALVFFGLYAAAMLNPIIKGWGVENEFIILLTQTILSTGLVLITAEFLPKALVQINPNGFLRYTSIPMLLIYYILYFPTFIVLSLSAIVLRLLRVETEDNKKVFSKIDLEHYVQDINERLEEEEDLGNEVQILQNALDFGSVKARDCMVPRTEIVSVEINNQIDDLRNKFVETGLSKIIVYKENIDNIIGYVHSFEMFKSPESIKQILLPIPFIPEAKPGKELLELFTEKSGNIAVVVDEYGGTAGIVTIEDVIEEIFGEIEDEHDKEDWMEEQLSEKEFRFSARTEIDYINQEYELDIEVNDGYETLGGLLIFHLAQIPEAGTKVDLEHLTLIAEEVSDHRIDVVKIIKK